MSNIFTRIKDSITQDVHNILDEKEEKNPIAALNHYLRQSEQEKDKIKKLLERQYRLKEQFTKEWCVADDLANKRENQANIARNANEVDLLEFAEREYEEYASRAARLKVSREEITNQIYELEIKYKEMTHKLKDMHLKRMELMGRENVARANQQMNTILQEDAEKPYSRFSDLEKFIENIENKVNQRYYESTFDQKIAALERESQQEQATSN